MGDDERAAVRRAMAACGPLPGDIVWVPVFAFAGDRERPSDSAHRCVVVSLTGGELTVRRHDGRCARVDAGDVDACWHRAVEPPTARAAYERGAADGALWRDADAAMVREVAERDVERRVAARVDRELVRLGGAIAGFGRLAGRAALTMADELLLAGHMHEFCTNPVFGSASGELFSDLLTQRVARQWERSAPPAMCAREARDVRRAQLASIRARVDAWGCGAGAERCRAAIDLVRAAQGELLVGEPGGADDAAKRPAKPGDADEAAERPVKRSR